LAYIVRQLKGHQLLNTTWRVMAYEEERGI